jgi:diphosphomevalonate decarboxylase
MATTAAQAFANIAFIKYWGNRNDRLRLPSNGSISMNLSGLATQTCVSFEPGLKEDCLILNQASLTGKSLRRLTSFLNSVRRMAGRELFARVTSENNFPTGAGIASSASAYAALALAASHALGMHLGEIELSRLARLGSGSAARSVPGGFVEWQMGEGDADSYAFSIAPPDHWNLVDLIAIVANEHKPVGSTEGHHLANSSPLQAARLASAPQRLEICRQAILKRDFTALSEVTELDSNLMHAVMMTSRLPLFYWQPASLALMKQVPSWRKAGLPVCYTLDAGPNVHLICQSSAVEAVRAALAGMPGVLRTIQAHPGGPAQLINACSLEPE